MKAIITYSPTNIVENELEETGLYCPNCAAKRVYVEQGIGDYYQGPAYYCTDCSHSFTIHVQGKHPNVRFE